MSNETLTVALLALILAGQSEQRGRQIWALLWYAAAFFSLVVFAMIQWQGFQ